MVGHVRICGCRAQSHDGSKAMITHEQGARSQLEFFLRDTIAKCQWTQKVPLILSQFACVKRAYMPKTLGRCPPSYRVRSWPSARVHRSSCLILEALQSPTATPARSTGGAAEMEGGAAVTRAPLLRSPARGVARAVVAR